MTGADKDPLDGEITVSAKVTENSVEAKLRSRTSSALDRLLGNIADQLNPWLERRTEISRAKKDGEVAVIKATYEAAAETVRRDEGLAKRAVEAHLRQLEMKQANKEAVAIKALEYGRELPPPADDLSNASESIEEDWLNFFESYAEKASSESMQKLWGRILTGEIRRPGAFSLTTLRVASELDAEAARLFQQFASSRISNDAVPKQESLSGKALSDILRLELMGLCQGPTGFLHLPRDPLETPGQDLLLLERSMLSIKLKNEKATSYQIGIISLSHAGEQLAVLVPRDDDKIAQALVGAIKEQCESITMLPILAREKDGVRYSKMGKVIYQRDPAPS